MTTFHSLPPELVDEILRSDELSIKDLAQSCLVSQQFLSSARRPLYSTITIWLELRGERNLQLPDQSSSKLLATIRQNLSLGRYCSCLRVEKTEPSIIQYHAVEEPVPSEMVDEWFGLLPNLEILSSPCFSHDRFRPSTLLQIGGQNWTALDLNIYCVKEEFGNLSAGGTLKKLRCRDFEVFGGHDRIVFPSSVVTVDLKPENWAVLNVENSNFATLHPPPDSQVIKKNYLRRLDRTLLSDRYASASSSKQGRPV